MQEYSRIIIPALVCVLVALVLYGVLGVLFSKEQQQEERGMRLSTPSSSQE
jgi:hypothetical protein